MRILFFGDSITFGQFDEEKSGWVQRLRLAYEKLPGDKHELYNLGISGNLALNVVKRLALEADARRWYDEKIVIVIAIGINDSKFKGKEYASTPEFFKGELAQILSAARQYSEQILFVGINSVDESLTNPFAGSIAASCYSNERIEAFETTLAEFCKTENLPFVPIYEATKQKTDLLADGLHPNAAGHQLIADLVHPELDKLLS